MIVALKKDMANARKEAARIFAKGLPESQLAKLGYFFLRDIYFGSLLDCSHFHCEVFMLEDSVAGFITYTDDGNAMFRELTGRHFSSVILACFKGFFRDPFRSVSGILQSLFFRMNRDEEPISDIRSEILTLAVSREHQKKTDTRISNALYERALRNLSEKGVATVKTVSRSNNLLAGTLNRYFKMDLAYSGKIRSRGRDNYSVFVGNTKRDDL